MSSLRPSRPAHFLVLEFPSAWLLSALLMHVLAQHLDEVTEQCSLIRKQMKQQAEAGPPSDSDSGARNATMVALKKEIVTRYRA